LLRERVDRWVDTEAGVGNYLGSGRLRVIGRDDGSVRGHCFEKGDPESFTSARRRDNVSRPHVAEYVLVSRNPHSPILCLWIKTDRWWMYPV
jgi:hypothetical protein